LTPAPLNQILLLHSWESVPRLHQVNKTKPIVQIKRRLLFKIKFRRAMTPLKQYTTVVMIRAATVRTETMRSCGKVRL
jgi:hypothetical protein